jgi:hypothetical protein
MEGLNPTLGLILSVRYSIDRGDTVRLALRHYLRHHDDELSRLVAQLFSLKERSQDTAGFKATVKSRYARAVLEVLERGFQGEAILQSLLLLEEEVRSSCQIELEEWSSLLPLKALIPLLLLQFPALLMLLFGPLLRQMIQSF